MGRGFSWLAVAGVLLFSACREPAFEPTGELIADAPVAEKYFEGFLLEFGSPSAKPHLDEGWSHGETAPDGNAFRWAIEKRASFAFESARAGSATAWIEVEPYISPDGRAQVIHFRVNGKALPPLELRQGRGRYPLGVGLTPRRNEVVMDFDVTASQRTGDRRRLAAAFYRFEVPNDEAHPLPYGPFSVVRARDGRPGIYVPNGSSLSYYTTLPEKARLVVTGGAPDPMLLAPSGASLDVTVRPIEDSGSEVAITKTAAGARGEVLSLEPDVTRLEGKRVKITLGARSRDLFVAPEILKLKPAAGAAATAKPRASPANVLVIVLDGASALRMSAYGYPRETTPVIAAFAKESVVFDAAVSQAVYTIASVGSFITGQYPERHQSVSFADRLPASAVTLPGLLTLGGLETAGFAGNKVVSSVFGLDRGYQEFFEAWRAPDYKGHGESVTRLVVDWLERKRSERFFAYVHYREPHFPYVPPPPFDTQFAAPAVFPRGILAWGTMEDLNRAAASGKSPAPAVVLRVRGLYEGNLAYADAQVGVLLEKVKALGLWEKTAIVITADHGEALFEHGYFGHNTQLYEESLRVPLIIRVPGVGARRLSPVVELVDLAPTVLELAGVNESRAAREMAGRSLVPLLRGESLPERPAYSRTLWDKPRYSVRDARFKLIWDSRTGATELYDLTADPAERRNAVSDHPLVTASYTQMIYRWLREQEHLRSGASAPEESAITNDLGQYLGTVGYLKHLRKKKAEGHD